ncbi:MAG: class I SAM-dependent methyltransferase, partial [Bacteroidota bacterium]
KAPNVFFKEIIDSLNPGKLLLPGEGEGRNAVYAAQANWQVEAFDLSEKGQEKALKLAQNHKVAFNYQIASYESFVYPDHHFDLIALIYTHMLPIQWQNAYPRLINCLKPGGLLLMEGFHKNQLGNTSGGPKRLDMLWDLPLIRESFKNLEELQAEEVRVLLDEGLFHQGEAELIRWLGKKS